LPVGIIPGVDPQLLVVGGFVLLVAGALVLLSYGSRFRVGRLLAATPAVSIATARAIAEAGRSSYLRVDGRIDSGSEFEDSAHRPLVFRRTRIQVRRGRGWTTVEDGREAVPFELSEGLDAIAIDSDALDVGLVVVPRESTGRAADLGERMPADVAPDVPARAVIEQVSSVEHATVLGVPVRRPDGTVAMTAGAGRPLVLTTLDRDDAMRILTGGDRLRPVLAVALLAVGLGLVAAGFVVAGVETLSSGLVQPVVAAEPTPTPGSAGDPRSEGQGPGLVGAPFAAIGAVLAIGLIVVVATLVYVRLTERRPR
jgi:hypothetical protein